MFVDLGERTLDLFAALYAEGVVVRRMGQFGASQNSYRISIGTVDENDRLIEATRKVLSGGAC